MLKWFLYADVPFVGCVPNTTGYCCLTTDVADASVSAFFGEIERKRKRRKKKRKEVKKLLAPKKNFNYKNLCDLI